MTTEGKKEGEGTAAAAAPDVGALTAQMNEFKTTSEALSRTVSELQAQIAAKDKELTKWQKKGKERDADVDKKAGEGDTSAWEQKLADMRNEFADKEEGYVSRIAKLETEQKHDKVISKGIAKAAEIFNADALPLIQLLIERNCDLKDGQVVVKDEKGEVRYSGREPMTIEEYLKELATKHPSAAKASGQSGGDTGGRKTTSGANQGTSYTPEEVMRASPAQQAEMIAKGDTQSARNFLRAVSSGGRR